MNVTQKHSQLVWTEVVSSQGCEHWCQWGERLWEGRWWRGWTESSASPQACTLVSILGRPCSHLPVTIKAQQLFWLMRSIHNTGRCLCIFILHLCHFHFKGGEERQKALLYNHRGLKLYPSLGTNHREILEGAFVVFWYFAHLHRAINITGSKHMIYDTFCLGHSCASLQPLQPSLYERRTIYLKWAIKPLIWCCPPRPICAIIFNLLLEVSLHNRGRKLTELEDQQTTIAPSEYTI